MDEEKKNDTEETKPKEGKIKGFFKKVGQKLDDVTYDYRLKADFDKNHPAYGVFGGTAIIDLTPDITAEEHLDEDYIITLSDHDAIKKGNLIQRYATGDVFHIALVERVKLNVPFAGKDNEVDALKVCLGDHAEKVDVIKVGDSYYLK